MRAGKRVSDAHVRTIIICMLTTGPAIESRVARIKARVAELTGNMGHEPAKA